MVRCFSRDVWRILSVYYLRDRYLRREFFRMLNGSTRERLYHKIVRHRESSHETRAVLWRE